MTMTGNAGNAYYKRYDTSVILDLGLDLWFSTVDALTMIILNKHVRVQLKLCLQCYHLILSPLSIMLRREDSQT